MEDDQAGDEISHSISPLVNPGGLTLTDSEKTEIFAHNPDTKFQPVTDPPVAAVIEIVDVALRSYFISPASDPQ